MSRQGIVGKIWRNIKHTIRVTRTPETCVGQDENGTKFYERVPGKTFHKLDKALDLVRALVVDLCHMS